MRNTTALMKSAKSHTVREVVKGLVYSVRSGGSGAMYSVTTHSDGATCTCKWGTAGGNAQRDTSGCSHVAAVTIFKTATDGKKVALHDGEDAARRQKRRRIALGQGLFATVRVCSQPSGLLPDQAWRALAVG